MSNSVMHAENNIDVQIEALQIIIERVSLLSAYLSIF